MPRSHLKDIQSQPDNRNLPINQVGVKNISYPVVVLDKTQGEQHTVATVSMYVDLPHHFRGTHMSRFIEILNRYAHAISTRNIREILPQMKTALEAKTAYFEITFPYFVTKTAPVSGEKSLMDYPCTIKADSSAAYYALTVRVPVQSLCPCSKEISEFGAHNQRSFLTICIHAHDIVWIEDIISIAEQSASTEIFSLLKREDEKYLTETAYNNPMFAEDMVRAAAEKLLNLKGIVYFSVEAENMESIHNHSAYARIERRL